MNELAERMKACARGLGLVALLPLGLGAAGQCPGIKPAFTWANNGSSIVFTDLTVGDIADRTWVFGDGDTAYNADAVKTHVYDTAAVDTVTLAVNSYGCEFSVSALVVHAGQYDACVSQLNSSFAVAPSGNNNMVYTDQSQGDGSFLLYLWTFGDDSISIDTSVEHFYVWPGAYDVSHSIGTLDTLFQTACVAGSAQRVFVDGNSSTCDSSLFLALDLGDGSSLQPFEAQIAVFDESLSIQEIIWDFGDGTGYVGTSSEHHYLYEGEYQVCVQVNAFDSTTMQACIARACDTAIPQVVSVDESTAPADLRAWPVPFRDEFWLGGTSVRRGAPWRILDAMGREILSGAVQHDGSEHLDTGALPSGLYSLVISDGPRARTLRLSKE
jgi:hypothetical protein